MGSLSDRCSLHPQRRVVGICAHCLHERLTLLIESISAEDGIGGESEAGETNSRQISSEEHKRQPPMRSHLLSHGRSASNVINTKASTEMALHTHAKLEDSLNLALQKVKHAHQQLSYVAQSPYQGVIQLGPAASPAMPSGRNEKHVSMPASRRRSNASESDMRSFPGLTDPSSKRKNSWFSISRGKNSLLSSPLPPNANKLEDKNGLQNPAQVMILAGRKSASDAIGRTCNNYRQAYMADLESIAEINLGEAAIKVGSNESNADGQTNASWISSFFHRRRGARYKPDERPDAGINDLAAGGKVPAFMPDASINLSPLPSVEAGRLSWDGPRPSFKQMLKWIEARKKQQRVDCSPLHTLATDGGSECFEDAIPDQASAIQKCKSVAASRRGTSLEVPKGTRRLTPQSPMLNNNVSAQMEYTNGDMGDRESRSWGRAWNRTLSPLLGKNNGRKATQDAGHQHPGYSTPNHVNFKSSRGAPPSASSFMSPLSRSQCALDAQIQIAQ